MISIVHKSVLTKEVADHFAYPLSTFIDATVGAGGHSFALLSSHPELQTLYGIDQDPTALLIAKEKLAPFHDRFQLLRGNFSQIDTFGIPLVDGILADLGVSSMQLNEASRGMSFQQEGPLDMRMDPREEVTAEMIVNEWPLQELARIFKEFGEEPKYRKAAEMIVNARPLKTTKELVDLLLPLLRRHHQKIHPLTLIFQALRMAVNRELESLNIFLPKAFDLLKPKGRLAIITFHSLEDRIVKKYFRALSAYRGGKEHHHDKRQDLPARALILTKKPMIPSEDEMAHNPRCRSAKLRVIEKL